MLSEFKKFVLRGNVVDLSTGVIIGAAFTGIVTAFADGVVKPLLKLFTGDPEKVTLGFEIKPDVYIDMGLIISSVINFLITAVVVFFVIIKPINRLQALLASDEKQVPPSALPPDVKVLTEIRDLLQARVPVPASATDGESA